MATRQLRKACDSSGEWYRLVAIATRQYTRWEVQVKSPDSASWRFFTDCNDAMESQALVTWAGIVKTHKLNEAAHA